MVLSNITYYEASIGGLLRTIITILIIIMIIRLIARLAYPIVIRKAEETMRQRADEFYRRNQDQRREGDIKVEKNKTNNSNKQDDGDYVDFVEIKD